MPENRPVLQRRGKFCVRTIGASDQELGPDDSGAALRGDVWWPSAIGIR